MIKIIKKNLYLNISDCKCHKKDTDCKCADPMSFSSVKTKKDLVYSLKKSWPQMPLKKSWAQICQHSIGAVPPIFLTEHKLFLKWHSNV